MQAEKGLEGHGKTLALIVQPTESHEGQQGDLGTEHRQQAGRQTGVRTAVRLGNSHNFSESGIQGSFIICTMGIMTFQACVEEMYAFETDPQSDQFSLPRDFSPSSEKKPKPAHGPSGLHDQSPPPPTSFLLLQSIPRAPLRAGFWSSLCLEGYSRHWHASLPYFPSICSNSRPSFPNHST